MVSVGREEETREGRALNAELRSMDLLFQAAGK